MFGEKEKKLTNLKERKLDSDEEISLFLQSYDYIFSDFDPRHYSARALSDDFLHESKKVIKDKPKADKLKILIPKEERNLKTEKVIIQRLETHFSKHENLLKIERKGIIKLGLWLTFSGIVIMALASILLYEIAEKTLITSFLLVLFEPAGWFLFWEGLDYTIFETKRLKPELQFYSSMTKCKIEFASM